MNETTVVSSESQELVEYESAVKTSRGHCVCPSSVKVLQNVRLIKGQFPLPPVPLTNNFFFSGNTSKPTVLVAIQLLMVLQNKKMGRNLYYANKLSFLVAMGVALNRFL